MVKVWLWRPCHCAHEGVWPLIISTRQDTPTQRQGDYRKVIPKHWHERVRFRDLHMNFEMGSILRTTVHIGYKWMVAYQTSLKASFIWVAIPKVEYRCIKVHETWWSWWELVYKIIQTFQLIMKLCWIELPQLMISLLGRCTNLKQLKE